MARTKGKIPQKVSGKDNERQVSKNQDKGKQVSQNQEKARVTLAPRKKIEKRKGKAKKTMTRIQKIQVFKESYGDMTRKEVVRWRRPKPRTNSEGLFGTDYPAHPTRIDILNGIMRNNCAKKTILGAIRAYWPVGIYTWTELEDKYPQFADKVLDEFYAYFRHKKGQSRSQSEAIVFEYVKSVCKRTLYEEKVRAYKKGKKFEKPLEELCPSYFSSEFWEGLLKFWESEDHQHRSKVGVENRLKVINLHSSGARPFEEVAQIMKEENGGQKPKRIDVWNRTHTRVGSGVDENGNPIQYTTDAAMEIAVRYAAILKEKGIDETNFDRELEPFDWWLQATAPGLSKPKKGRLVGYPRVPARQLLQDMTQNYKKRIVDEADYSIEGSSCSGSRNIPNATFSKVVSGVLNILKENPDAYQKELNEEQVESLAEAALSLGDPTGRIKFSQLISEEVVRVVKDIVTDLFDKYKQAVDEEGDSEATLDGADYTDESDQEDCGAEFNGEDNAEFNGEVGGDREISSEDYGDECEGSDKDDDVGGN